MKGSLFRLALVAIFLQLSCNAALAVTWFDSNIRPDGACDSNSTNASTYVAPADDSGSQTVSASSADTGVEVVGAPDVYDSGD